MIENYDNEHPGRINHVTQRQPLEGEAMSQLLASQEAIEPHHALAAIITTLVIGSL